jgi:hypothetical protein
MAEAEKKSFFSGLSGTLAAITALITAIGGLIAVLIQVGVIGGSGGSGSRRAAQDVAATSTAPDWASEANKICAQTNDAINALPDPKTLSVQSGIRIGRQAVRMDEQMFRDLAALPKPADKQQQIDNFLRIGARMNNAAAEMFDEFRLGNIPAVLQAEHSLSQLNVKLNNSAIALGATTCAEGPSMSTGLAGG